MAKKKKRGATKQLPPPVPPARDDNLVDMSVTRDGAVFLHPQAPKACWGRKYMAAPGPCVGRKGRGSAAIPACPHRESCARVFLDRANAGVNTLDDLRLPASMDVPAILAAEAGVEVQSTVAPKASVQKDVVTATVLSNQPAPVPADDMATETTITDDDLQAAEARLDELERAAVRSSFDLFLELGRVYRAVRRRMNSADFAAWVSRIGRTPRRALHYIAFIQRYEDLAPQVRQALDRAPGLTFSKFTALMETAGPEHLLEVLGAEAPDRHGATKPLTALPQAEMRRAAKSVVRQVEAESEMGAAVERAQARDEERRAEHGKQPPAPAPEPTPKPFYPPPVLTPLVGVRRVWDAARQGIEGNLASLSAKDLRVLAGHANWLEATLLPDLRRVLALSAYKPKR